MKRQTRSSCPISYSLDIFGDKWTLLILRDVLIRQKRYYQDFLISGEGISTNILAHRLKNLVNTGLLIKTDNPKDKRQPVYSPTKKAAALLPVLSGLAKWGVKFGAETRNIAKRSRKISERAPGV